SSRSRRNAIAKKTSPNVPSPFSPTSERAGSVEKIADAIVRTTSAPIGAASGVGRANGPRNGSPRRRADSRQRMAQAAEIAKAMFAIAIAGAAPAAIRKKEYAARSKPRLLRTGPGTRLRRSRGARVGGERLVDQHHRDVGDDRVDAPAD